MSLSREQLQRIYEIVDAIPFSKNKKNIHRDFSDGLMMAQLVRHYRPDMVQQHNYPQANSIAMKRTNWQTLNNKVLKKIGLPLKKKQIQDIITCSPNSIQLLLKKLFVKMGQLNQEQDYTNIQQLGEISLGDANSFYNGYQKNKTQQSQQIQILQDKIQKAYMQLMKLNEASRLKDGMILNLQRRFDELFYR